jgi:large subunit ribosomal protein L7/L12
MAVATKMSQEELLAQFDQMTVLELSDFVKKFEDHFGVTAVSAVAATPAASAGAAAAEAPVEEQTEFSVVLTNSGQQKINVIKAVREITQLGLKEAKALVDEAPKPIIENVPRDRADEVANKLKEAGAEVEVK